MMYTDGLENLVSGIGTDQDKTTHYNYTFTPIPQYEADAMYRGDWLSRKIIDIIPDDMTREWRTWQAEQAEEVYKAEKSLAVKEKINEAKKWARLYGGAAILIGDGTDKPEQPLEVNSITKDGIKYLRVFSRYDLSPGEINSDLSSEYFKLPEIYSINGISIHRSRFVIFDGLPLPPRARETNQGWGDSVFDAIKEAILHCGATNGNIMALINEMKIDIVKVPALDDNLSTQDGTNRLTKRFNLANRLKSTIRMLLLGADETYEQKQANLNGLPELMRLFLQVAAGAADIPITRLLGQSPSGLASTGESDIRNYYDNIRSQQNTDLRAELEPLDNALIRHTLGDYPEGISYEWNSLWQMSPQEKADVDHKNAQTDKIYIDSALFPDEALRKSITDKLVENGTYPSLDQHILDDTDNATD